MKWVMAMRGLARAQRRAERPPHANHDADRARHEVALYDSYVGALTSLHRVCPQPSDAASPPLYCPRRERAAKEALAAYQPSEADCRLGRVATIREELLAAVLRARELDQLAWQEAMTAARLRQVAPFEELRGFGEAVHVASEEPWRVRAALDVGADVVPDEIYSLGGEGELRKTPLSTQKQHLLYRDHIASGAIRVARELVSLLPIELAIVDVRPPRAKRVLLSAAFPRTRLEAMRFEEVDALSALKGFPHRMNFRPASGLEPVEAF